LVVASWNEIEGTLTLAEQMLQALDAMENRRRFLIVMSVLIVALTSTRPLVVHNGSFPESLAAATVAAVGVAAGALCFLAAARLGRHIRRDRRALSAMVDVLWSMNRSDASLSPVQRSLFRIRLSRFEVGPPSALDEEIKRDLR